MIWALVLTLMGEAEILDYDLTWEDCLEAAMEIPTATCEADFGE
jgi:hypothetical protein